MRAILIFAALAQAASAQFALSRVDGAPLGAVLDMGTVYPAEPKAVALRVRNVSDQAAAVTTIGVNGTGFALGAAPKLPVGLGPEEAFEFTVVFQASAVASYSAAVDAGGASVILTAAVLPALTHSVGAAGISFGTVEAGAAVTRRVTISNLTGWAMPAPPVSVAGEGFAVASAPAGGTVLQPSETAAVEVRFQPGGPGNWTGTLALGDRTYPLNGSATGIPLPRPAVAIELAEAKSGQAGWVRVVFDASARTAGAGTLTISLEPLAKGATDPAVGKTLPFTVAPGDTGLPPVAFQTGTTAGTIAIAVELGGATERKTVEIPASAVVLTEAAASRGAGTIEVRLTGFDNTRSAGRVVYTFYDSAGNALPAIAVELGGATERKTVEIPASAVVLTEAAASRGAGTIEVRLTGFDNTRSAGRVVYTFYDSAGNALPAIEVDNTAEFARHFTESDAGGTFALRAVFPVTGDGSQIAEFAAEMRNSAGNTVTGRTRF